jgi:hypothetical protein
MDTTSIQNRSKNGKLVSNSSMHSITLRKDMALQLQVPAVELHLHLLPPSLSFILVSSGFYNNVIAVKMGSAFYGAELIFLLFFSAHRQDSGAGPLKECFHFFISAFVLCNMQLS